MTGSKPGRGGWSNSPAESDPLAASPVACTGVKPLIWVARWALMRSALRTLVGLPVAVCCWCPELCAVDSLRDTALDLLLQEGMPDSDFRFSSYSDTEFESSVDSAYFTGERGSQNQTGGFVVADLHENQTMLVAGYAGGRVVRLGSGLRFLSREQAADIGPSGLDIPTHLSSLSTGAVGKYVLDDDDTLTWRTGVYTSGNRLFAGWDQVSLELELFHRHDLNNGDSVFWGGFWYHRQEPPAPALGYVWRPTPDWEVVLGYPFARIHWRMAPDWELDAVVSPVWEEFDARVTWHMRDWVDLGTRITLHNWESWPSGREDDDDVLGVSRWRTGVFAELGPPATAQIRLEAGYSFGRELNLDQGSGLFDGGGFSDAIDFGGSVYTRVGFELALP